MQDMFVSCLLPVLSFRVFSYQENEAKWNVTCETGWKINKCGKYFNFWVPWSFCLPKVMSYEFSRLCKAARLDSIVRTFINWSQQQVPAHNPNKQTGKIMLAGIEIVVCLLWKLEMWRCVESMSFLKLLFSEIKNKWQIWTWTNDILSG